MTICIAAYSHPDKTIVAASDRMLTLGNRGSDNAAIKQWWFHPDWFALISGDVGLAAPIVRDAEKHLDQAVPINAEVAAAAIQAAWIRARMCLAEAKILSPYGLTMARFLQKGATHFGPNEHARLCRAIEEVTPDCDFLVCGFGEDKYPHILGVQDGVVADYGVCGYWAVGSGADLALGALASREHSMGYDTSTTTYNVLDARFAAEADVNVGKDETLVIQVSWRSPKKMMHGVSIAKIKRLWKSHRAMIPPGALDIVNEP